MRWRIGRRPRRPYGILGLSGAAGAPVATALPAEWAFGIALGFAADLLVADPRSLHPVAGFGRVARALEERLHPRRPVHEGDDDEVLAPSRLRLRGIAFTALLVGGAAGLAASADLLAGRVPGVRGRVLRTGVTAVCVWSCHGGTSLLRVADRQAELLARDDVAASRELLPWLCGRDPSGLDADDLARAVVESVAENTSDAAVATLFWAAVAGPAGAVAHRAANTLDAMVGHRSECYAHFGWASARLDDVLGWPSARAAGLLTAVLAPVVGGRPSGVLRAWRRDAPAHPSPNAGVAEAACAGALGIRLGGPTPYPHGVESRPVLGTGPLPGPADVRRAVRLMRAVQGGSAIVAVAGAAAGVGRAGLSRGGGRAV